MINEFKKGIVRGIGILLVVGGGLFAFQVTGTIKTWTTGETLTAADLNTTVQSLKTAVEGANQFVQMEGPSNDTITIYQYRYKALTGGPNAEGTIISAPTLRGGTLKNVRMALASDSNSIVACRVVLLKNGTETDIDFAIPANTPMGTIYTDSHTVTFVAGDSMLWRIGCDSNHNPGFKHLLSFEF